MLSPSQRAAVERWGQDVCVVAGPGSGKTRVLIERYRWLMEQRQIAPHRILAVTFTEKAATEIKKRLMDAFSDSQTIREDLERAWISTIHGFCTRLLREHAMAAGIDPDFRVLDEAEARNLLRQCAQQALDHQLQQQPARMRQFLQEFHGGGVDLATAVIAVYEEARSAGVPVESIQSPRPSDLNPWEKLLAQVHIILADPPTGTLKQREAHLKMQDWARAVLHLSSDCDWLRQIDLLLQLPRPSALKMGVRARSAAQQLRDSVLAEVVGEIVLRKHLNLYPVLLEVISGMHREYAARKRQKAVLDFEDLQEIAIRLLESQSAIRAKVRDSFDHVLMDELQDTNYLQWRLIELVRKPDCLFMVGDVNQSIYSFRHAGPAVFQKYRDELIASGRIVDELRENYRSRPDVIDVINTVSPYLIAGVEPHRLLAQSAYDRKDSPCVEFLHTYAAREEDDPVRTEARWIARRIREIEGREQIGRQGERRPARFSDIAVLTRTIAGLAPIQAALDEFGIPCLVSGGRSFYETREVRDLVAYLAVLANPLDEISLAVVLRSPLVSISDDTLLWLKFQSSPDSTPNLARAIEQGLAQNTVPSPDRERLGWFWRLVKAHRSHLDSLTPDTFLAQIVDESGYQTGLSARARANIAKLYAMVREWALEKRYPLFELVDELKQRRLAQSEPEAAVTESANCVHLMSVHAAKGLEFPIVFVAALRSTGQNRRPPVCLDEQHAIGVAWRHPLSQEALSDSVHLRVSNQRRQQEKAEEDRLLYVAMTRAADRLIFTASPVGLGDWAKQVAEALQLPATIPREESQHITYTPGGTAVKVIFTSEAAEEAIRWPGLPLAPRQEAQQLDRIPSAEQYDATVAVTAVAQFALCPRQYYLARYLRWPARNAASQQRFVMNPPRWDLEEQPDTDLAADELGVLVHDLLAGKPRPDATEQARALARGFQTSALGRRLRRALRQEHEFDFMMEVEGMILRGQIDLWFEEGGELLLVDFKSDDVEKGQQWWHAQRYHTQIQLYSLALERLLGRYPNQAILWYLRTQEAVPVSLDAVQIDKARRQVRALREAQNLVQFPLREGPHCLRCRYYRGACPSLYVACNADLVEPVQA
ncbi:MAG: UvrD-helicase domain-containing protein [Bryobacteraceae bacterium]|nr:UvrD-helicase domain-containing protein [Bryobacteraceae bacterium]MDW8378576.1 UvrD-helicase domain-containing protein [Bryobacterales bacterium]